MIKKIIDQVQINLKNIHTNQIESISRFCILKFIFQAELSIYYILKSKKLEIIYNINLFIHHFSIPRILKFDNSEKFK